jgi:multidrug efflux system outer membrane protein
MYRKLFLTASLLPVLLSGCSFIPKLDMTDNEILPESFPADAPYDADLVSAEKNTSVENRMEWQKFFKDEQLKSLISIALENNNDLKAATLRIAEAQAIYGIEQADSFPQITGNASFNRQRTVSLSDNAEFGGGINDAYRVGVGLLSYELDFFGRVRAQNEAALNQYLATQAAQQAIQIGLIANIAQSYISLKANQALLKLAEGTVKSQQESFNLIELRQQEGIGSDLDVKQAETLLHQAQVDKFQYINAIEQDKNALRLLMGRINEIDLTAAMDNVGIAQFDQMVADIPVGLPSDLITNRPDIIAAEYELKSANANIGAARAAFFPSISLTGNVGYASTELSGLFENNSQTWGFGPQVNVPIFPAGRLRNNLDLAEVRTEIEIVNYEDTIQTAFREVMDALSAVSTFDDRVRAQENLVDATATATRLSNIRYQNGIENYLTVLDAKRELYRAEQGIIIQKAAEMQAKINLYQALGGGADIQPL